MFGTLFGLATSLGLGGQQVGAGASALTGSTHTTSLQVILVRGIDRGIRRLSLVNLWLASGLMLFVFFTGPSLDLLNTAAANVGHCLQSLAGLNLQTFPGDSAAQEWQASWTLFCWGWWISWSPFVGMFIARISCGRTIRAFVVGTLLAPVGASMVWLTVLGNPALELLLAAPAHPLAGTSSEAALFVLLNQLLVAELVALAAPVTEQITAIVPHPRIRSKTCAAARNAAPRGREVRNPPATSPLRRRPPR